MRSSLYFGRKETYAFFCFVYETALFVLLHELAPGMEEVCFAVGADRL